jgi:hypothetical protein
LEDARDVTATPEGRRCDKIDRWAHVSAQRMVGFSRALWAESFNFVKTEAAVQPWHGIDCSADIGLVCSRSKCVTLVSGGFL